VDQYSNFGELVIVTDPLIVPGEEEFKNTFDKSFNIDVRGFSHS